jgi:hypothetical protein
LVALATRWVTFGNPVVDQDDQFYLLVGDSMRHGQWPYLDIWDRKPVGLFLLFTGIAGIGGTSILFMQLVATAFVAATAWLIRSIALRLASPAGALMAALAYLVMLPLFGGQNGQSPIFYNVLVAGAFLLLADAATGESAAASRIRAYWAMLLCGLALTIKPVSVAEGIFIGCAFLWLLKRQGERTRAIFSTGATMAAIALLPSLATLAAYAVKGPAALDIYVRANFISIFNKASLGSSAKLAGLAYLGLYLGPLLLFALMGAAARWKERGPVSLLVLGWIAAAFAGYLLVPNFFDHYALPLLAPLCISAASLFARRDGALFFAGLLLFCLLQGDMVDWSGNRRARAEVASIGRTIEQARHRGCLFVADGPAWLYAQSPACRVTPYLFPGHLTLAVESRALEVDQRAELERVLNARPAVIVTRDSERDQHLPAIDNLLYGTLQRDYRSVARLPNDSSPLLATLRVWQRRDLPSSGR